MTMSEEERVKFIKDYFSMMPSNQRERLRRGIAMATESDVQDFVKEVLHEFHENLSPLVQRQIHQVVDEALGFEAGC